MTRKLDLAVIESRWWEDSNVSVRGLFDVIASISYRNPDAYHYEMFNNKASLEEIVSRIARKKNINNLCIAAHGDEKAIYGAEADTNEGNIVRRETLRNILRKIPRGSLNGLYLGTCLTGNMDTVQFLLSGNRTHGSRVCWVAGYSKEIKWLQSAAVDLYFWTTYYGSYNVGGPHKRINRVAKRMEPIHGLCEDLGFNIYVRKKGPGGGVEPLLEYEDYEDDEDDD